MAFTSNPHRTPAHGAFDLSPTQLGLWAAELWNPNGSANVTAQYSDIQGALNVAAFERASRQVIEETEALRLCFGDPVDPPVQWVVPLGDWSLPVVDFCATPDSYAAALAWMRAQLAQPLEVNGGRAFRWTLLKLSPERFIWSFQVHHLLLDGFSRNTVWRRLDQVYSAYVSGVAVPPGEFGSLQELFSHERLYAHSAACVEDRRFFVELLKDRPAREFLAGEAAARNQEFRRATVYLPADLTERLRAFVRGASLAPVITAAAALMQRGERGGEDLIIGLAVSARVDSLARRTPSMLSNVVPLRLQLAHDLSIEEAVSRARFAIRAVLPHQRYPLRALRKSLRISPFEPDPHGITVNFMPFDVGTTFGGHAASTHNLSNGPVADLTVGVFDSPGTPELRVDLNGNKQIHDDIAVSRHLDRLVTALAAIGDGPATRPIGALLPRPHPWARLPQGALDESTLPERERYWQEKLAGAPERMRLSWRAGEPLGADECGRCRLRRPIPGELTAALGALGRQWRGSRAMLWLAIFETVLRRWTDEFDLVIGVDIAVAPNATTAPVALRVDLSGDPTLFDIACRNQQLHAEALAYRVPYERLLARLGTGHRRVAGLTVCFSYSAQEASMAGEAFASADLHCCVVERSDDETLTLDGASALYDHDDLVRLHAAFESCLSQLCGNPELTPSQIAWISAADVAQLAQWNATTSDYRRDQPLTKLLRAQAARTPAAIAVEIGDYRLTYADLYERADALAARLKQRGVTRDARVGLFLDRHETLPQAMLAILEAGGGYVPLDPALPRERLGFMIADAQVCAIVTRSALLPELPPAAVPVICVDDGVSTGGSAAGWLPADASSLAYVLYTSGSTGKPKGVAIEHRQLVNLLTSMACRPGIDASDALLAVTPISFDIAGLEIWLPLLCGARLCLAGHAEAADGELLARSLARSGATLLQATPSTWRSLLASGWCGGAGFKALVGGEALPADLAQLLATRCGEAWNLYGPTETTIWSSAWRLQTPVARVRVGQPIANTELHVLDAGLRQLPIGQPGDLFIGGEGVGRGYLNRDDLTAHCFLPDPFRGGAARMYRTGDIARWLPDGTLELIGRTDDQLKVRGHRVEAGEVEAALLRLPGVSQAVVAMHRPDHGDPRLVAYLVAEPGAQIPPSAELRAPLREWLAEYMLPYHFVPLSALPLTPNGKVDRRALTGLYRAAAEAAPTAQPPCELEPSALEAELLAHFSRVLGCQVTLDSDFFEAGGDSLGVLRLIARVLQERGLELRSGELFMHSTPRRMAAWLGQLISGAARPDHLVALREGSSSGAVILVHPMSGHLASYGRLVHLLGSSVTLFGLQAGTGGPAYTSIGARCMAYVEEVMMAAAEGPLILGGYSLGGALAMEMAEQLRRAGRAVSAVLLMDAQVPRPPKRGWAKLRHRAAELRRFSWHDRHLWLRDQILRRVHNGRGDAQEFGEADGLISQAEIDLLISQALRWEPPRYTGKVHLFRAERNIRGYANPRGSVGWDPYCSNLEVLMLPCNHREIMGEPHVMRIVSVIDSLLARATPAISNKSNQRFKTAAASSAAILGVRQPLRTPQV